MKAKLSIWMFFIPDYHGVSEKSKLSKKGLKLQTFQLSRAPWEAEINFLIIFFPIFMNESIKDFAILNLFFNFEDFQ